MHDQRVVEEIPHLYIVGRRGWLNEAVFQRLDTLPFMGKTVFEQVLDDTDLARRMAAARAVLFPSLAEGYGLPLAEALAAGTPVLASDLPALREVGQGVPEFLPTEVPDAWQSAITDYTVAGSTRRQTQIDRMAGWIRPSWEDHFAIVENALETILVHNQGPR